jgi:peptidoglycan/LPS O-acetylase OafA/YrhL
MSIAQIGRIGYIDGLRAVAVLGVVANHAVKYAAFAPSPLTRVLLSGHHGVELFFVISGFCLAHPTLQHLSEHGSTAFDVVRYAAKRMVRILPPYYIALVLFALLSKSVDAGHAVRQALFLDHGTNLVNPSFWTLSVEFRWYFVFPLALLLWVRSAKAFLAVICGLYMLEATNATSLDVELLPLFMLGIVAADVAVRRPAWAKTAVVLLPAALLAAFVLTPANDNGGVTGIQWDVAMFLLVVASGSTGILRTLLSVPALTAIGVASYSIYLVNEPIAVALNKATVSPWIIAVAAVMAGFAFWAAAERPFTDTKIRTYLIADLSSTFRRWLPRAGIATTMMLNRRPELREVIDANAA